VEHREPPIRGVEVDGFDVKNRSQLRMWAGKLQTGQSSKKGVLPNRRDGLVDPDQKTKKRNYY